MKSRVRLPRDIISRLRLHHCPVPVNCKQHIVRRPASVLQMLPGFEKIEDSLFASKSKCLFWDRFASVTCWLQTISPVYSDTHTVHIHFFARLPLSVSVHAVAGGAGSLSLLALVDAGWYSRFFAPALAETVDAAGDSNLISHPTQTRWYRFCHKCTSPPWFMLCATTFVMSASSTISREKKIFDWQEVICLTVASISGKQLKIRDPMILTGKMRTVLLRWMGPFLVWCLSL